MKTLQFTLFIFQILFSDISVSGKDNDSLESHSIPEVCIYQTRGYIFKDDKFFIRFDSLTLLQYQNANLGELLQLNTPAIVNFYGSTGSIATLSFRGTGANHTQVSWNGFPINAISTGEMDLSLASADIPDQLQVINTASGAVYGSGTVGGTVELNNYANWNNRLQIKFNTELGLFDQEKSTNPLEGKPGNIDSKSFSFKFKIGSKRIQSSTLLFDRNALNKYPFIDYMRFGNPINLQGHNKYNSGGFLQNIYFKLNNYHQIEAGVWLQRKYYEVPTQIGSASKNDQSQRDSTLKTYLKWQWLKGQNSVIIKSGWFYDYLHYASASINSIIASNRLMNDINCRRKFSDAITVDAGMSFYRLMSLNNNYITNYSENWYTIYSDVQFNLKRYIFNFSIQKYFLGKYNPVVQLSLGTNIRLSSILIIKANVSNKFRQPTFNEKYWIGLGNPDIKPEKGWGFDAGTEAVFNLTNISNKAVLTCYSNLIDDWIQWTPPSYIPRNYKQVWSRGIESSFEQSISIQKSKVHWSVKYNYTPTTTTKLENDNQSLLNKQLMLIPVHNLNGNISAEIKSFNTGMTLSYRGKRYNTNDESGPAMDSYALINLNFGKTFIYKLNRFLVDFKINNLFDKQYEMISAYPMPGRAFYISITFLLNQSN